MPILKILVFLFSKIIKNRLKFRLLAQTDVIILFFGSKHGTGIFQFWMHSDPFYDFLEFFFFFPSTFIVFRTFFLMDHQTGGPGGGAPPGSSQNLVSPGSLELKLKQFPVAEWGTG